MKTLHKAHMNRSRCSLSNLEKMMKKLSVVVVALAISFSVLAQSQPSAELQSVAKVDALVTRLLAEDASSPRVAVEADVPSLVEKLTVQPDASCTYYQLPYVGIIEGKQYWGFIDRYIPSGTSCYISDPEPWDHWVVPVKAGERVTFAVESSVRTFFSIDGTVYFSSTTLQPNGKYLGGYIWQIPASFNKSTATISISPYATSARYSIAVAKPDTSGAGTCTPSATSVCLLNNRFRVNVSYKNHFVNPPQPGDFAAARLNVLATNPDVGIFGLNGDPKAVEIMVRIADARPYAPRFDVYYGGLTDLEYWISVTDTLTGTERTYYNPPGKVGAGLDRGSFPTN